MHVRALDGRGQNGLLGVHGDGLYTLLASCHAAMLALGAVKEDLLGMGVGRRVHRCHVGDVGVVGLRVRVDDMVRCRGVGVHLRHHVLLLLLLVVVVVACHTVGATTSSATTLLVVDGSHGGHHLRVLGLRLTHGLQGLRMELLMLLLLLLLVLLLLLLVSLVHDLIDRAG